MSLPSEQNSTAAIYFYPQPAGDILKLENPSSDKSFLVLLKDQLGKIQVSANLLPSEKLIVDVRHLPPGIYFLCSENESAFTYAKIIISR
jgi:hypothetical protein